MVVGHFHGGLLIEANVGVVYICLVISFNLPAMRYKDEPVQRYRNTVCMVQKIYYKPEPVSTRSILFTRCDDD